MPKKLKTSRRGEQKGLAEGSEGIVKPRGLFDHINHIREVQDPNYFDSLTEADKKSWSNFTVLLALSMNQKFIEYASVLYQFFDIIPPAAMYRTVIGLVDRGKDWSKWVKAKPSKYPKPIVELVSQYFKIPKRQAKDYVHIYLSTPEGKDTIREMARDFGKNDKEIAKMFKGEDEDYE